MVTAQELAEKFRVRAEDLKRIGGYSVEAEAIISLTADLADLAQKVAALEALAKHDLVEVVEGVLRQMSGEKDIEDRVVYLPDQRSES